MTKKRCIDCEFKKDESAFDDHRNQCKQCRARKREKWNKDARRRAKQPGREDDRQDSPTSVSIGIWRPGTMVPCEKCSELVERRGMNDHWRKCCRR